MTSLRGRRTSRVLPEQEGWTGLQEECGIYITCIREYISHDYSAIRLCDMIASYLFLITTCQHRRPWLGHRPWREPAMNRIRQRPGKTALLLDIPSGKPRDPCRDHRHLLLFAQFVLLACPGRYSRNATLDADRREEIANVPSRSATTETPCQTPGHITTVSTSITAVTVAVAVALPAIRVGSGTDSGYPAQQVTAGR